MIYLSGPTATTAEYNWNSLLADNLRAHGYRVLLPQEFYPDYCLTHLLSCAIFVMNCDGYSVNAVSAMEFGYALGNKKTILYQTDVIKKDISLITDQADAFIYHPLGTYSEIGRSIIGHIK